MAECFANRQANIQKGYTINDVDFEQVEKIPFRWFRRVTRKSTNFEKFVKFLFIFELKTVVTIFGSSLF